MLHDEPCIACVGAISLERGLIHLMLRPKSMKGKDFETFLLHLRSLSGCKKLTVVCDNSSIHHTKGVWDVAARHGITLANTVCYMPWQ